MKIIEHGQATQWQGARITCNNCHAVLDIEQTDLTVWQDICGFYEDPCAKVGIVCPECFHKQEVEIPSALKGRMTR